MADSKPQGRVESTIDTDLDSGPVPGGCFHSKRGTDVELSKGNTEAAIVIKNYGPAFDGNSTLHPVRRLVFSSEPINPRAFFRCIYRVANAKLSLMVATYSYLMMKAALTSLPIIIW